LLGRPGPIGEGAIDGGWAVRSPSVELTAWTTLLEYDAEEVSEGETGGVTGANGDCAVSRPDVVVLVNAAGSIGAGGPWLVSGSRRRYAAKTWL
jgi:hypothetical protein